MYKAEAAEMRQREKQNRRIKGAVQRMLNAKVTASWNTWHAQYEQRRKFVKVSPRVALRQIS